MGTTHGLTDIALPSLDPSMEEGTVISWHVAVGEPVTAGQVIAEIETAKATVDLEAPVDGVIATIEVPEGSEPVSVGTTLARVATGDRTADSSAAREKSAGSTGRSFASHTGTTKAPRPLQPAGEDRSDSRPSQTGDLQVPDPSSRSRVLASPRARRLAREKGLDLDGVTGSGPNGRVMMHDLESAIAGNAGDNTPTARSQPPETTQPLTSARLSALGIEPDSYRLEPLTGMRKTIAHRTTESFREAPHFSLSVDLELDRVMQRRHAVDTSAGEADIKLGINDFIVWAAAMALKDVPEANSSYTEEGLARHQHANIAIAVAIDGGLVAPVVRAAETKSVREIASEIGRLVEKARARRLEHADITGGTFTVSNLGMYGITSFTSVLTAPQACVLSIGAAEKRPLFSESGYSIATLATVTLTCDHRVVDGVIGAEFLSALRKRLDTVASAAAH